VQGGALNKVILALIGFSILSCGSNKTAPDEKRVFEQGQAFETSHEYQKAEDLYLKIVKDYPQSTYRYKALFMAGYVEYEYLKDTKKAIVTFDKLIKEYPTCDLADDAAVLKQAASSGRDMMSVFEDSLKNK
jgi:TolA-binding protein